MRILMISDHADPLAEIGSKESGGQNIFVYYLSHHLSKVGIWVDVYTRWNRTKKKEVIQLNKRLRVIRIKAGPKAYMPRDNFLYVLDEFTTNVLKHIKEEKLNYSLIYSNYWFSGLIGLRLARKLKIPQTHIYHSIGQIRFHALKHFKVQKSDYLFYRKRLEGEKKIALNATGLIATTPVEKEVLQRVLGASRSKIKVITEGVDRSIFQPTSTAVARERLRLKNHRKIILYVGRIEWRKGIGTLLYAFSIVLKVYSAAQLFIIGGGRNRSTRSLDEAERNRLQGIISDLGLGRKVRFLGPKEHRQLALYYSAANLTVVPSYYEAFGLVPLESMACGTPVIASNTGGLRLTVAEGITGYHARPRDYEDLAKKIELGLVKGKNHFTPNCLKRVETHFLWEKVIQQYVLYFNQLIANQEKQDG